MTTEELEQQLRSAAHPPLSPHLKAHVLAHALDVRKPRPTSSYQRWLGLGLAAAWLVIIALQLLTPGVSRTSFTQAALAKAGTPNTPVSRVNPATLMALHSESLTTSSP